MNAVITNHPHVETVNVKNRVHVTPVKGNDVEEIVGYAIVSGRKPAHMDSAEFASAMASFDWESRWIKQAGVFTPHEYAISMQRDRGALAMAQQHAGNDADLEALMLLTVATGLFCEGVL